MAKKHIQKKQQTFSITAPGAISVILVGTFTQWQKQPIPLKRDSGGIWRVTVALPPGSHHYRFIVDGQWYDDPECPLQVTNPYGTHDSVRQVS